MHDRASRRYGVSRFERVFEIGPAFRAEHSFAARHETEFTSVDMEAAWIDSHRRLGWTTGEAIFRYLERYRVQRIRTRATLAGSSVFN